MRKKALAGDRVTTEKTLQNALQQAEVFYNFKFDICVFLTCTNIFRQARWVKEAVNIFKKIKLLIVLFQYTVFINMFGTKKIKNFQKFLVG